MAKRKEVKGSAVRSVVVTMKPHGLKPVFSYALTIFQNCHPERRENIREANILSQSKDPATSTPSASLQGILTAQLDWARTPGNIADDTYVAGGPSTP
jgi:hypothetical protein